MLKKYRCNVILSACNKAPRQQDLPLISTVRSRCQIQSAAGPIAGCGRKRDAGSGIRIRNIVKMQDVAGCRLRPETGCRIRNVVVLDGMEAAGSGACNLV